MNGRLTPEHCDLPRVRPSDGPPSSTEEDWPRYYRPVDDEPGIAYLQVLKAGRADWITVKGERKLSLFTAEDAEGYVNSGTLARITREEAEARLDRPPSRRLSTVESRYWLRHSSAGPSCRPCRKRPRTL